MPENREKKEKIFPDAKGYFEFGKSKFLHKSKKNMETAVDFLL